jgi:spermidine synthase
MNWLVFVLFFISGACGLIYEVVWSRMMFLIFGRSSLAVGTVLAAFMSGLALGGWLLGKYADRSRNPLRFYAILELGVSLTAFAASFQLTRATPIYIWIHTIFGGSPLMLAVVRFMFAFQLLVVPTVLMGATLPVLSRVVVQRMSQVGHDLGRLYAINTIGAVAGSLATGFYLIASLGLHRTIDAAVIGNLTVGILAWLASRHPAFASVGTVPSPQVDEAPSLPVADTRERRTFRIMLWVFALSGVTSFAYEVFWTRSLVFLLGNTTYAFTLMLTAFLSGIALGSFLVRFVADRVKSPLRLFAAIEFLIGVLSAAALPFLFFIARSQTVRTFVDGMSGEFGFLVLSNFGVALLLMLLPATLIGATFPLLGRIFLDDVRSAGTTVGKVYAVNTLGNVLGALLPGLLLLPLVGIEKGVLLMAGLNVALGIVLLLARWKHAMAGASASLAAFLLFAVVIGRMHISFQFPSEYENANDIVFYYDEGDLVTTKVWDSVESGYKMMSVDGINIGGTADSDYKQQILAHLPKLLLKSYSSELSIGLGSGILIGESARHPALTKVVCVEISEGVVAGARYFSQENYGILNDPRARIVVDDVADFLQETTEKYDIISADEKTAGKYASNAFSYSTDYYSLLKRRLAPGGLVIQWVPTDLPHSQYLLAVRTFLNSFPHVTLWYFPPVGRFTMSNTFLIGSIERIEIDPAWMRRAMETEAGSFQGIRKYGLTTADAVLSHFVATEDTLRRAIQPGPLNTFDEPYYEFYSPRDYAVDPDERTLGNHELLLSMRGPDFERFVRKGNTDSDADRLYAAFRAEGVFLEGHRAQLRAMPEKEVIPYYDRAVGMSPWNENLRNEVRSYLSSRARLQYLRGNYAESAAFLSRVAEIYPQSSEVHHDYGMTLLAMNQTDPAIFELEKALALNPRAVLVRRALASVYASRGQIEKAVKQWKDALAIDQNDVPTLLNYGSFLAEQRFDLKEAMGYLQRAYQLAPENPVVVQECDRIKQLGGDCRGEWAKHARLLP